MSNTLGIPPRRLDAIYRVTSVLWAVYAAALAMSVYGSVLIAYADPGRYVVSAASVLIGLGMLVRLIAPRSRWTGWTLPLMGTVGVTAFVLSQFGADMAGGFTPARTGYGLLLLVPALIAYVHWIAERVVAHR